MGSLITIRHVSYLSALALDFKLRLYIPCNVQKEEGSAVRYNWEETF